MQIGTDVLREDAPSPDHQSSAGAMGVGRTDGEREESDHCRRCRLEQVHRKLQLARSDARRIKIDKIATGDRMELPVTINARQALRAVLGWSDPEVVTFPDPSYDGDPLAAITLVNDLDVKVIDPSGADVLPYVLSRDNPSQAATRGVNHVDNTEEVEIRNASAGTYKIVVTGASVTVNSPQTFVLVTNGELGVAALPC